MIVIGFYKMLSIYIQTFNLPIDAQEDGNWVQKVRGNEVGVVVLIVLGDK